MKINRRSIAAGLTVGVLAGGAGGAIAATTSAAGMASTSSTTATATGGSDGDGFGWGSGWQDPPTGLGWSGLGGDIGGMPWTGLAQASRQAAQIYLGLSESQLASRLQSGTTLAEIASSQGKSGAGLESAVETAVADTVNADGSLRLSAGHKSSIIADLTSLVDSVVTRTWAHVAGRWHGSPAGPMTSGGW